MTTLKDRVMDSLTPRVRFSHEDLVASLEFQTAVEGGLFEEPKIPCGRDADFSNISSETAIEVHGRMRKLSKNIHQRLMETGRYYG